MRGACSLRDFLELVRSARDEDQVRACLDHDGDGEGGMGGRVRIRKMASHTGYYRWIWITHVALPVQIGRRWPVAGL